MFCGTVNFYLNDEQIATVNLVAESYFDVKDKAGAINEN